MGKFARDTAVEQISETIWRGQLCDGWQVLDVPNGGYVLAIAGRALSEALPHRDPLAVNAFYLAPTQLGPIDCHVQVLRRGSSTSFAELKMYQEDELKVQVTAAYTDLNALEGKDWSNLPRPQCPHWEELPAVGGAGIIKLRDNVDMRLVSNAGIFTGEPPDGSGEFQGWLRHADGADSDALSMLLFADAAPPPIFAVYGLTGWVPTLEFTVQLRAQPAPGPIQIKMSTRALTRGVLEESGEYWDSDGQLVAMSRQTAKFRG